MSSLQTVAMGLVIVFLDVGPSGYDWVADPLGWVLVLMGLSPLRDLVPNHRGLRVTAWVCLAVSALTWPPSSVAHLDEGLGWLFSLPTLAFCFLVCDAVMEVSPESPAARFRWLRNAFALSVVLPLLLFVAELGWLTVPTAVLVVLANVVLVLSLWAAGAEEESPVPGR
jgi:hypothetical protein